MVRGHDSHRWVGTGDNKHLKRVWIDPYEKNKDKPKQLITFFHKNPFQTNNK